MSKVASTQDVPVDATADDVQPTISVGRVVIANRGLKARALFGAYAHVIPRMKQAARWVLRRQVS